MPNDVYNYIVLTCNTFEKLERVLSAFKENRLCNEFIPCPTEIKNEQQSIRKRMVLGDQDSYETIYRWNLENWGTTIDIGDEYSTFTVIENYLILYFTSAWTPPCKLYQKLHKSEYEINAYYSEMGYGLYGKFENGTLVQYNQFDWDDDDIEDDDEKESDRKLVLHYSKNLPDIIMKIFGIEYSIREEYLEDDEMDGLILTDEEINALLISRM